MSPGAPRMVAGGFALTLAILALTPAGGQARRISHYNPGTHATPAARPVTPPRHPAPKPSPPETTETTPKAASEEARGSSPPSTGSWPESDGGGSPLCRNRGVLSPTLLRNCETSDFVAAPDPTGNYAFDVNINTSASNWGNDIAATIQNFLQFGWIALVALVHGLLLMLEWCYSLNLLSGSVMSQIATGLHETQLTFTKPWMMAVLAVASVLALYHGLIRRRVAATLGQVLMTLAMMVGGLVVIANPQGTVGQLAAWADEASLSTLSAVTSGNPNNGKGRLAGALQNVFSTVVTGPWCYMEFGNERWCYKERDEELRSAALKIAASEEEESKCGKSCAAHASAKDRALSTSARLLREARSNGELFLALPANEKQRNSVKTSGALLNVLCKKSESADDCADPTAAQAEFRTEKGTEPRVIGLVLIWIGALGMLLLLGYLAFRLLEAAIASIFYLLLAPAAVLAPALGDGGRAAFRGWSMRLLSAVTAKLIYSLLLGVVLLMVKMLMGITTLGWWAQWLLVSTLWWVVLHHRHKVLSFTHTAEHDHGSRSMRWYYKLRMAQDAVRLAGWARHKLAPPVAESTRTRRVPRPQAERQGPGGGPGAGGGKGPGGGPAPVNGAGPSSGSPPAHGLKREDEQTTTPERRPVQVGRPPAEEHWPEQSSEEPERTAPASEPGEKRTFDSGYVAAPVADTAAKERRTDQPVPNPGEPELKSETPAGEGKQHHMPASAKPRPAAADKEQQATEGGGSRRVGAPPATPALRERHSDTPAQPPASKAAAAAEKRPPAARGPEEPKRPPVSASASGSAHRGSSATNENPRRPATDEVKQVPFSTVARGYLERTSSRPPGKAAGTSRRTQLKKDDPEDHDSPRHVPRPSVTKGR